MYNFMAFSLCAPFDTWSSDFSAGLSIGFYGRSPVFPGFPSSLQQLYTKFAIASLEFPNMVRQLRTKTATVLRDGDVPGLTVPGLTCLSPFSSKLPCGDNHPEQDLAYTKLH